MSILYDKEAAAHLETQRALADAQHDIERLKDRAESAEAVLRVTLAMVKDEAFDLEDLESYLESSMEIIKKPLKEASGNE